MNKKGFTLVELLAVIVILGIVLVIATPKIFNSINIGKAKANIINQNNLLKSAKKYYAKNSYDLPENIGESKELSIDVLISEKYMSSIISPYDKSKQCSGYVLVVKLSEDLYDYIPNLDCTGIIKTKAENKLIFHYTFNDFQEPSTNEYDYPTFDTATASGGWSHWGQAGAIGSHGQNTDIQYIYDNNNYSHWVKNETAATGNYLLYKSPAFDGGYRSILSIIKLEDGSAVTDNKVYPAWNAGTAQSIPNGKWTSITNLGNGFYLCKADGIHQDGSNDLVGIYVKPGIKAYFSYMQLERKPYSTPVFISSRTGTINDYSGNNKNSSLNLITTPRWINEGYYFNGVNNEIVLPNNIMSTSDIRANGLTYSIWIKPEQLTNQRIIGQQISSGYSDYSNGGIGINSTGKPVMIAYSDANPSAYVNEAGDTTLTVNKWSHIVGVYDNINNQLRIYVNGKLASSPSSIGTFSRLLSVDANRIGKIENASPAYYKGYLDEIRIYNRVLSASEILSIYDYESDFFN